MHFLLTPLKALCLLMALGAPTLAFANQATTPATPSAEAPVQAPVCLSGPSWKEAGEKFVADMVGAGATFHGIANNEGGGFTVIFDVRNLPDFAGGGPVFIIGFDKDGCFIASALIDEATAKDMFGLVLAVN